MWVLAATGNTQFQIESMLAVKRDTQAAIKTIGFKAHESNRSEETQLSSHRPSAPTCPATHTGQFRRHGIFLLLQSPTCYHRMHRDTFNYIHHVTALHRIVKHQNVQKCSEDHTVFEHFDFQMCVSPQRQAIFRQLSVRKCSEDYNFLNILTFKCAFRHSGMQFFDI